MSYVPFPLRNICSSTRRLHVGPLSTSLIFTEERALGLWSMVSCEVGFCSTLMPKHIWVLQVHHRASQAQEFKNLTPLHIHALPLVVLGMVCTASHIPGKYSTTKPHPQALKFSFLKGQFRPGVCCFKKARHKTLELTPIQTNCAITKRIPGFMLRFTTGFL